jgi:hypothetical protein
MSLGRDLLDNFETWPLHIQESFLELVSYQVIVDEEVERQANLSLLDQLMDEFRAVLTLLSQRSLELGDELSQSEDTDHFLKEFLEKQSLLHAIGVLQARLSRIEGFLKK